MSDTQNLQIIKEQLRIKNLELKKKDAEKTRQEDKVRQILELSRKKINDLKLQLQEQGITQSASTHGVIRHRQPDSPEHSGDSSKNEGNSKPEKVTEKAELLTTLEKLKKENLSLTNRIQAEKEERQRLLKEKNLLLKEIKRLRNDPSEIENLKKEVSETEKKLKESQLRYEALVEEKRKLVEEYDKILREITDVRQESAISLGIIEQLKSELSAIKIERENLEVELREDRQLFESKLSKKIADIQEEWERKAKNFRIQKDRITHFADQVMDEPEAPLWMITYSDMATLLLTFFILYYSIASQNVEKFRQAILGEAKSNIGLMELLDQMEIRTSLGELSGLKSNDIMTDINNVVKDQSDLDIAQNASKIVVRAPGSTLFKPASAVLEKEGWPLLDNIISIFKKYPNYRVHIQGHTDDYPISTEMFPTNWELSSARATAVLRYFIDKGIDPKRLTATGYAETFPLSANTTAMGRAKNRRVEFVLEKNT